MLGTAAFAIVLTLSGQANQGVPRTARLPSDGPAGSVPSHMAALTPWNPASQTETLWVGQTDPNETLYVVDTTWTHAGELRVINSGVLLLRRAAFTNLGKVTVQDTGTISAADSSTFAALGDVLVLENATLSATDSSRIGVLGGPVTVSGQSIVSAADSSVFSVVGNVLVFSNGEVSITSSSRIGMYGNVVLSGDGVLAVDSSEVKFNNVYWWQFTMGGIGNSEIRIHNSHFLPGLPILTGGYGSFGMSLFNSQFDTWLSGYLYENASIIIDDCHGWTGEYCIMDSGTGSIAVSNSDTVGIWLTFPAGSAADFTTFYEEFVEHWDFPNDVGASGIPYTVTVDSTYLRNTSVMIYSGSAVTLRNSLVPIRIRAIDTDSLLIVGLEDNTFYEDSVIPLPDSYYLHLKNTTALTYSIYAVDSSVVSLDNCRVSEVVCTKNSCLSMTNSVHNGTAGAFWVWDNATAAVANSVIQVESVVRGAGRLSLYNSCLADHPWWPSHLYVEDGGVAVLLNSTTPHDPTLRGSSLLYFASVDSPSVVPFGDSVAVYGSAYMDGGPDCQIGFDSYRLSFADSLTPQTRIPIGPEYAQEVDDGLLDHWNTDSLPVGTYAVYLRIRDSVGDSVETYRVVHTEPMLLKGTLSGGQLVLDWRACSGADAYWIYGACNEAYFLPGFAPEYAHRQAVVPSGTTTWASGSGIGNPDSNWTYLVVAPDPLEQEICRSNRVGAHDWAVETPSRVPFKRIALEPAGRGGS